MKPTQINQSDSTKKDIDEWLAKGNKIEKIPYGKRSDNVEEKGGFYGRKKKTQESES
jgi:hypothetical protein